MSTFLSDIHFWTVQGDIAIKDTDYGSYKYYHKKYSTATDHALAKRNFCEQTGITHTPHNKRPDRLRDRLKELEDYLVHNKVIYYNWESNVLRLLLSTGLIVNLTINLKTGDLTKIVFDKQLFLKLQVNIIADGTLFGPQVICVCNDGHILGFGGPWREGWILEGGPRRRLNYHNEWLLVYGKMEVEHPQPWSPLTKDHQRANLHLYYIGCRDPELLAYKKTEGDPLLVVVSKICTRTVIVVEQRVTQKGAVSVEVSSLELIGSTLKRISVTSVPLQTQVSCTALSEDEERLLIGCIDGSLAILNRNRGSTRIVKAAFIATLAAWHNDGVVVAIANDKGHIQYYDTALNCIKSQMTNEDCTVTHLVDLSGYFNNAQINVMSLSWGAGCLIVAFEQGPLAILTYKVEGTFNLKGVARQYIKSGKVEHAVKLLLSWDFCDQVFFVLHQLCMTLLRKPLTEEVAQLLQETLGSFHSSPIPVPTQLRHKFGHQVMCLTRRFFHQLVRVGMFETAFLLAVDVGHHDLFMDLHYVAVRLGETEMAAAARAQASALLSRCSSEASNCSRSLCSQCSDSESCSSPTNYDDTTLSKPQKKPAVNLCEDNVLTTDFMQPNPTTYKEENEVKVVEFPRKQSLQSRATYVRAPQVPSDFVTKQEQPITAPPLPFYRNLGLSYIQNYVENVAKPKPSIPTNQEMEHNISGLPTRSTIGSFKCFKPAPPLPISKETIPPPLPRLPHPTNMKPSRSCHNLATAPETNSSSTLSSSMENLIDFDSPPALPITKQPLKKGQTKVKFSDTVTAFIVPEVKRAVKPSLPSHLTDPQRELAESLPLCHPNEDYLKDFAPQRHRVDGDGESKETTAAPPKIKVVHFGVV